MHKLLLICFIASTKWNLENSDSKILPDSNAYLLQPISFSVKEPQLYQSCSFSFNRRGYPFSKFTKSFGKIQSFKP